MVTKSITLGNAKTRVKAALASSGSSPSWLRSRGPQTRQDRQGVGTGFSLWGLVRARSRVAATKTHRLKPVPLERRTRPHLRSVPTTPVLGHVLRASKTYGNLRRAGINWQGS
jgi:hypothetical protein